MQFVESYFSQIAWMYDPIGRHDLVNSILNPIYSGGDGVVNVDALDAHQLAIFFIVVASGALHGNHPLSNLLAERYHLLARAAFSREPISQMATCFTIQALLTIILHTYYADHNSNEERWLLVGLCGRLAQRVGLQRDCAEWNLEAEEVQRRRNVFWQLFTFDIWMSFVNGRPPALNIQHTDCRYPDDLDQVRKASGDIEMGYHSWAFRFAASCLTSSVQCVFSTKPFSYNEILELDKKLRCFPVPSHLEAVSNIERPWSTNPTHAMQQFFVTCQVESNLLLLHRKYFALAISEENPLQHEYADSVLAVHRSACALISDLRKLYSQHRELTSVMWQFWTMIFSACVVLGTLVVESPGCALAENALLEFELALPFFEEGSGPCRPPNTLQALKNLFEKASANYSAYRCGAFGTRVLNERNISRKGTGPDLPGLFPSFMTTGGPFHNQPLVGTWSENFYPTAESGSGNSFLMGDKYGPVDLQPFPPGDDYIRRHMVGFTGNKVGSTAVQSSTGHRSDATTRFSPYRSGPVSREPYPTRPSEPSTSFSLSNGANYSHAHRPASNLHDGLGLPRSTAHLFGTSTVVASEHNDQTKTWPDFTTGTIMT
jgi:hypothetical protein